MSFDLEKQVDWNQIYNDENLYKITEKKWKNVKLKFNNYYEPEIKPLKNLSIINPETNEENFRTETTAVLIRKEINNTNFETVTKKVYQERKNVIKNTWLSQSRSEDMLPCFLWFLILVF